LVRIIRPPRLTPPRALPPVIRVIRPAPLPHRGLVIQTRVNKPTPVPMAGGVLPPRVIRFPPPWSLLRGMARQFGPLFPPPPTIAPPVRVFLVRAKIGSSVQPFSLRAGRGTNLNLRAGVAALWNLRASQTMSIATNLAFFQGEDILLNFALFPPADITGWTLTGTVKDKLGGTTQFTFTPTITNAGKGLFQVSWPRSQTSALNPGDYVWDVRRTDTGQNSVLANGEITLRQPVTS
jgi:hypothetical protein